MAGTPETSEKKDRIVTAAMEIFGQRPYHQVKIEEIAERAGVGKGTVYEYFGSKEELFIAMIQAGSQAYFAEIVGAVKPGRTARQNLEAVFISHLRFIGKHAAAACILAAEGRVPHHQLRETMLVSHRQMERFIVGLVKEGVSSGEFRSVDAVLVSKVILGTLSMLMFTVLFENHSLSATEKTVDKLLDFYLHGMARQ